MHRRMVLVGAATLLGLSAAHAQTLGAPFDSRDPRTCPDKSEPRSGAITVEAATAYVICDYEGVLYSGDKLRLVYGITVQVGRGRPYIRDSDGGQQDIDTAELVYPIRGSMVTLRCDRVINSPQGPGKNCEAVSQPNATGVCYRTTFGEWSCNMADWDNVNNVVNPGMPAPK